MRIELTLPRWLLLLSSPIIIGLGIAGFFSAWGTDDPATLDGSKAIALLVLGAFVLWVGVSWSYDVRKTVTSILGIILVVAGAVGAIWGGQDSSNLGITHINRPWEASLYLVMGIAYLIAARWPRPFDYHD